LNLKWVSHFSHILSSDYLDIVNDPISSADYRKEEDPKLYKSEKTNRGPLSEDWINEHKTAQASNDGSNRRIMCAYKLCRVEFKYWGMQTKIEKFIDDVGQYFQLLFNLFLLIIKCPWFSLIKYIFIHYRTLSISFKF